MNQFNFQMTRWTVEHERVQYKNYECYMYLVGITTVNTSTLFNEASITFLSTNISMFVYRAETSAWKLQPPLLSVWLGRARGTAPPGSPGKYTRGKIIVSMMQPEVRSWSFNRFFKRFVRIFRYLMIEITRRANPSYIIKCSIAAVKGIVLYVDWL